MKVAVCLSGQLRTFEKTWGNIMDNVIIPNNADVFIHSWYDECNMSQHGMDLNRCQSPIRKDADKLVIELYKPKRYIIEKPRNFSNSKMKVPDIVIKKTMCCIPDGHHNDASNVRSHIVNNTYCMFYSIMKCNEICQLYSHECGIEYDVVVRVRFDITLDKKIVFSQSDYDINCINYIAYSDIDNIVCDWVVFGSPGVMNVFSSIFYFLEVLNSFEYVKQNQRQPNTFHVTSESMWGNEHLIRDMMDIMHIPSKPLKHGINIHYT